MSDQTIDLDALLGEHELSGVDFETIQREDRYAGDGQCIRFVLDGVIYAATEDENDGHRSCLGTLFIVTEPPVTNTFAPVRVLGKKAADSDGQSNDYVEFCRMSDGVVVLAVGTENVADYYPGFVAHFWPERMGEVPR